MFDSKPRFLPMLNAIKDRIAELGSQFDQAVLQETRTLYRPLLSRTPDRVRMQHDVAYAADARQTLDVYAPDDAAGLPIVIYVPGGGFVAGDKRDDDGFYANIGYDFSRRGFLVLIMNYRLAPQHPWPAGGQDVGYAVAWARHHAIVYGGDPDRIAVFGQSAGATHILTWMFDPVLAGNKPISALVLSSGTYRVSADRLSPNLAAYFGSDPTQYGARSPISHIRHVSVPLLLTVCEFDPPFMAAPTFELATKLTDANGCAPQLCWLAGHNHVSNVLSIGTPDDTAANVIAEFLGNSLS